MYITQLHIYPQALPLLNGMIYDRIATDQQLPGVELLLKSLDNDEVEWPGVQGLEVYYLDNLKEADKGHKFMLRWHPSASKAKDKTTLHIRINDGLVNGMSFVFQARGDRTLSSEILAIIKSASENVRTLADFEAQGFLETGRMDYRAEHKLSGFVWVPGLERYLHVTEDPYKVKEVAKGYQQL